MQEAGWDSTRKVHPKVAVLEGTFLSPTDAEVTKENGDPLNTLWGVMAYQLGGQTAYNLIGEAARGQDSALSAHNWIDSLNTLALALFSWTNSSLI